MKHRKFITDIFMENVFLVYDEKTKDAVLIDPGGREEEIVNFIKAQELHLHAIVATHCHADHIKGVARIQDMISVPFFYHSKDREYVKLLPQQSIMLGLGTTAMPGQLRELNSETGLQFGSLNFSLLHTPGHTPGGIVILAGEEAFVGDTIFAGSVGRTDLPGGDMQKLLHSIREKIMTLDDNVILHPGHGEDTTVGMERSTNPFINQQYPLA